jgi:hypothetical protein
MRQFWLMIVFVIACFSGYFFYAHYQLEYKTIQTDQ